MKSTFKWISLSLLVYVIFLVIKLPAVHVISKFSLPPELNLQHVSGTIWQGKATSVAYQHLAVSPIEWKLSAFPLLFGQVELDLKGGNIRQVDDISISGNLILSNQQIGASQLKVYIPAKTALSRLPLPVPVRAQGRLVLDIQQLDYEFNQGCQQLAGNGQWLNAKVDGVSTAINLGSFNALLSCDNNNVVVSVQEPNSLGLSAKASIPANLKFTLDGRFKPAQNLPKEVHQAAQFFGRAGSDGYYPLSF
jgi:general secretion pathway protein N